jgi:hypothetical protein
VKIGRSATAALAFLLFFGPILAYASGQRGAPVENRPATDFSELSVSWDGFSTLSKFIGDRIPLRSRAIKSDGWIDQNVFDEDPAFGGGSSPLVIHGNDGYLFLAEDFNNACGPTGTIDGGIANFISLSKIISDSGRRPLLMIPPNKSTIMSAFLPQDLAKKDCWNSFTTTLWNSLASADIPGYVDLRGLIEKEMSQTREPLYLRKDSHWNSAGSFVAIKSAVNYFDAQVWQDSEISYAGLTNYVGDLTIFEGMPVDDQTGSFDLNRPDVIETNREIYSPDLANLNLHIEQSGPTGSLVQGKTLLISDSFGEVSLHRIAPFFEDLTFIHFGNWDPNLFAQLISDADNVWFMGVERYFTWRASDMIGSAEFLDLLQTTLVAKEN